MYDYSIRYDRLSQYAGDDETTTNSNALPESIEFNARGYITLHYNYGDGELDKATVKRKRVSLYYSCDGSKLGALFGVGRGRVRSLKDASAKDKPKEQSDASKYSINLSPKQMDNIVEKINQYNGARYSLLFGGNNRIGFLKSIAKEVGKSIYDENMDDERVDDLQNVAKAYQKSNIKNGVFRYLRGDMSRTDAMIEQIYFSRIKPSNLSGKVNDLISYREGQDNHISTKDEIEKASRRYSTLLKFADKSSNSDALEELRKSSFNGKLDIDKVPKENITELMDDDIKLQTGDYGIDELIARGEDSMKDVKDWPLFPWRPCAADLKQGLLGDCWLEASLAGLADKHPECIENSLKDNGDGTVTGRIYDNYYIWENADNSGKNVKTNIMRRHKEKYYRVEKTLPMGANSIYNLKQHRGSHAFSANGCLWPEVIRKMLIKHISTKNVEVRDNNGKLVEEKSLVQMDHPGKALNSYGVLDGGNICNYYSNIFEFFNKDLKQTGGYVLKHEDYKVWTEEDEDNKLILWKHVKLDEKTENELVEEIKTILKNRIDDFRNTRTGKNFGKDNDGLKEMINDMDKNFVHMLLACPDVREILPNDIIRFILNNNYYNILKEKFTKSNGLMIAGSRYKGEGNVGELFSKEAIDKIGEVKGQNTKEVCENENNKNLRISARIFGKRKKYGSGVIDGHAHTVLGFEEQEYNGKKYYFVKLRNPWGNSIRYDEIRNGKVVSKFIKDRSTDGVGRMEILEFMQYFENVQSSSGD